MGICCPTARSHHCEKSRTVFRSQAHTGERKSRTSDAAKLLPDACRLGAGAAHLVLVVFVDGSCASRLSASRSIRTPRLSPRRPIFWIWLIVACVGIISALSAGNAIKEAFDQGPKKRPPSRMIKYACNPCSPDAMVMSSRSHSVTSISRQTCSEPRMIINAAAVAADAADLGVPLFLARTGLSCRLCPLHLRGLSLPVRVAIQSKRQQDQHFAPGSFLTAQKWPQAFRDDSKALFEHPPLHQTSNELRRGRMFAKPKWTPILHEP